MEFCNRRDFHSIIQSPDFNLYPTITENRGATFTSPECLHKPRHIRLKKNNNKSLERIFEMLTLKIPLHILKRFLESFLDNYGVLAPKRVRLGIDKKE